jgi:hypothetical protein
MEKYGRKNTLLSVITMSVLIGIYRKSARSKLKKEANNKTEESDKADTKR